MVKVPANNLSEKAYQVQSNQEGVDLTETWNEESARKNMQREGVLSPVKNLKQLMSNSATPVSHSRFGNLGT